MNEVIRQLTFKVDCLATHNKMLENQIAHQASSSLRSQGKFPGKSEINPNEHYKAITLWSGKQLEDPKTRHVQNESIEVGLAKKKYEATTRS